MCVWLALTVGFHASVELQVPNAIGILCGLVQIVFYLLTKYFRQASSR
jgi:hypothetical protein